MVIIIGVLALVLGAYLLASVHQDSEEVGGKDSGEPSTENPNITPR
jgi:hypothetical protein